MMIDIVEKARRVIYSCQNIEQAKSAERYLNLVANRYPHIDVYDLRKELDLLFNNTIY